MKHLKRRKEEEDEDEERDGLMKRMRALNFSPMIRIRLMSTLGVGACLAKLQSF